MHLTIQQTLNNPCPPPEDGPGNMCISSERHASQTGALGAGLQKTITMDDESGAADIPPYQLQGSAAPEAGGGRYPNGIGLLRGEDDLFPISAFEENSVLAWVRASDVHYGARNYFLPPKAG